MSDTPETVRAERLRIARLSNFHDIDLDETFEVLERYAELLERSAGVWVPVTERLPTDGAMYPVWTDRGLDEDCYHENGDTFDGWQFCTGHTHWLDVKLPGEQR
jgi:hypothetical protein